MSERNPGGDRRRWDPSVPPEWPGDDESPDENLFGPVTNDRYPEPHWPGETHGPGSSVFGQPTAPEHTPYAPTPTPRQPDRQVHLPPPAPPTAVQSPPAAPYTEPYPGQYPGGYPDPTRPQPQLPGGRRPGSYPGPAPGPAPGRRSRRAERRQDGYGEPGRGPKGGRGGGRGFPLGAGFLVGGAGLACFLLSLLVLPWFQVGGQDVKLEDIRQAFTIPATDPDTLPGANGDQTTTTGPEGALPTPGQAGEAVESAVRDGAAQMAASVIDTGKARYLELYTKTLWLVIAIAVSLAVLFSTILSPRSTTLGLLLGFRRLSGFVTVLAAAAHGAALWVVFSGDGPSPAFGIWLGVGGLAAVLLGCIIGPKR